MQSFAEVTDPATPLLVPEHWRQGRTAFGGIQAAAALRAAQAMVATDRAPRSVSASFIGPTGAEALDLQTEVLREGKSMTHARVDVVGDRGVACSLTAAFGSNRTSAVVRADQRIDVPSEVGGLRLPYLPGITPIFVQHFDIRWTEGQPPFTGATGALTHQGWCRHETEPGPPHGAILGLLDAWPSPALQALVGPAPASTVTWSAQLVRVPERITTDDAFFFRARVLSSPGTGFVSMRGELYDRDGILCAHLEQLVTVYG